MELRIVSIHGLFVILHHLTLPKKCTLAIGRYFQSKLSSPPHCSRPGSMSSCTSLFLLLLVRLRMRIFPKIQPLSRGLSLLHRAGELKCHAAINQSWFWRLNVKASSGHILTKMIHSFIWNICYQSTSGLELFCLPIAPHISNPCSQFRCKKMTTEGTFLLFVPTGRGTLNLHDGQYAITSAGKHATSLSSRRVSFPFQRSCYEIRTKQTHLFVSRFSRAFLYPVNCTRGGAGQMEFNYKAQLECFCLPPISLEATRKGVEHRCPRGLFSSRY